MVVVCVRVHVCCGEGFMCATACTLEATGQLVGVISFHRVCSEMELRLSGSEAGALTW